MASGCASTASTGCRSFTPSSAAHGGVESVGRERQRLYAGRQYSSSGSRPRGASCSPASGCWRTPRSARPASRATVRSYLLATDLTPEQLAAAADAAAGRALLGFARRRAQTAEAGLDARGYRLQFQTLLARPLLLVAMVLVSASFSLRFFRFGGVAKTLSGGVVAGFVLYIVTESPLRSRRRGHDQPSRRRLVACACREHVGHAVAAAFGGRLMRRPRAASQCRRERLGSARGDKAARPSLQPWGVEVHRG